MKRTVEDLIISYWNKNRGSDKKLIEHFSNQIKGISYKVFYSNKDLSFDIDDYIQAGNIAVFEACDKYKESGIPENVNAHMYVFIKHRILYCRQQLKKSNYISEISLDETVNESSPLVDLLIDNNSQEPFELVEKCIDDNMLKKELNNILKTKFDKVSSEIIKMKYGWYEDPKTNEYISKELGIGISKIVSIHSKSIDKFKNMEWTKKIGVLYFYGYKIKNIKASIKKDVRNDKDINSINLYSSMINDISNRWRL